MDESEINRLAQEALSRPEKPRADFGQMSSRRFAAHVRGLQRQLGGLHLTGIQPGIAVPVPGRNYFNGTLSPVVGFSFRKLGSGLFVPENVAAGPSLIDSMSPYLTSAEVFPFEVGAPHTVQWLTTVNRDAVLVACAQIMGRADAVGADWANITTDLARGWFKEPLATRLANLIAAGSILLTPQAILVTMKLAMQMSPPVGGSPDMAPLITAFLALQKDLNVLDEPGAIGSSEASPPVPTTPDTDRLFKEVVRYQSFSYEFDESVLMARHRLHWQDIPSDLRDRPEYVDLPAAFEQATGVSLTDLEVLGIALWVRAVQSPGLPVPISYFAPLGWAPEKVAKALSLITSTPLAMADHISDHQAEFGVQWSFDPLRRFPVVLLGDEILVLSPALLLERIFGWLPLFDLIDGLEKIGDKRSAARSRVFYERVCEREALDSLSRVVESPGFSPRLFDEDALRAAFGAEKKTADAVIDCADTWVVVEVSTRHLKRSSVVGGSLESFEIDYQRGIDDKVEQIQSTISELQADETRLTGFPAIPGRKYIPVLVVTEGFPVNPMTSRAISARLNKAGLLTDPGVAPLRILDQQDLYAIEHVAEAGKDGLAGLLEGYGQGNLREMPFRNWLVLERRLEASRPKRLERPFNRAWAPALSALRKSGLANDERASSE
jgi:hypothetical protein